MSDQPDVVVLGGGSGGYAAALRAAQLGLRVALVEKGKLGGTCLHRGCIPTKAILHAAEVADATRNGSRFGIHATLDRVDAKEITAYADSVVSRLFKGLSGLVKGRGISVVEGEGRLERASDGSVGVRVGDELIQASATVLASGSAPRSLPEVQIDGTRVLTSEHAVRLETLPTRAVVLGGGVIGAEFASAWSSLGVAVTIVEALPRLLPGEEPEISAAVERAFRKRGLTIRTGVGVDEVLTTDDGVRLRLADGAEVAGDVVLVAVGRGPVSEGLGYDEAGVGLDRGFIVVDERLQTSVASVYAVGDLVAGPQLAHRGFAHGIFVAEEIAHRAGRTDLAPTPIRDRDLPRVTYSDPEVASVGLTEAAAREEYGEVETLTYDLAGNGKSQILKTQGFVKLVRRPDGPVVGVHLVGSRVSELASEAQLITGWEAFPSDVAALSHAHPTQAEALGEAHLALAGKPLHAHG
ncbi:MAG TPA: dihydrolipoyl dehydrogenase [Microlunatus sp.]|nr:dihydrolipoyl dehydrogenase [Microlunatus sp.]